MMDIDMVDMVTWWTWTWRKWTWWTWTWRTWTWWTKDHLADLSRLLGLVKIVFQLNFHHYYHGTLHHYIDIATIILVTAVIISFLASLFFEDNFRQLRDA